MKDVIYSILFLSIFLSLYFISYSMNINSESLLQVEKQIVSETLVLSDYQKAFKCIHKMNPKQACKK